MSEIPENHQKEPKEEEEEFVQTIIADRKQSPIRLDKFLMDRLEQVTRNRVQNAIRDHAILVNGKEVKPNYKVRPQDKITVLIPRHPDYDKHTIPQEMDLDIRYEDDDVMIIHKPPGLVVHPGVGNPNGTLVNGIAWYYQQKGIELGEEGGGYQKLGLVHRIDKDTSGLMVIAKNEHAINHLSRQFFDHTIDRTYNALVWGQPDPANGTIEGNIGRHPRHRKMFTVYPDADYGKHAVTHFKTLDPMYYVSLVQCNLETGRTHQIRVHMKHIGHTLFSDKLYGGDTIKKGTVFSKYKQFVDNCFKIMPRQALHAKSLGFEHPTTGERMYFESELPEDFSQVLDKWRHYLKHRKEIVQDETEDGEPTGSIDI